ncbi:MAG: MnhB domain-containing protein [Halohasta sp.]
MSNADERRSDGRPDDRTDPDGVRRQRPVYTESQVIMTTVKAVTPFVMTYGLYITFHGADTPGGGFQGGAIIASVFLMIAFAFGIESTRDWLANRVVVGLATVGVFLFGAIGFVPILLGGNFLEYTAYYPTFGPVLGLKEYEFVKYGMEGIEILGIAFIVSGVMMGLFFALAAGYTAGGIGVDGDGGESTTNGAAAAHGGADVGGEADD